MRLIDADKLKERFYQEQNYYEDCNNDYEEGRFDGIQVAIDEIVDAPTIESRPHGHWIGKPIAGYSTVRCSVCGAVFRENTGKWKSCPECTAIMDEGIKNNER